MKHAISLNTTFIAPPGPFLSSVHEEIHTLLPHNSRCPRCQQRLDLVQPDVNRSEALLGVCESCPAWFFIDGRSARAVTDLGLATLLASSE